MTDKNFDIFCKSNNDFTCSAKNINTTEQPTKYDYLFTHTNNNYSSNIYKLHKFDNETDGFIPTHTHSDFINDTSLMETDFFNKESVMWDNNSTEWTSDISTSASLDASWTD